MKIRIRCGQIDKEAQLDDSSTAKTAYDNLPIKGSINRWGDEIYFDVPFHIGLEVDAREVVFKGEIGFWPEGDCFCIFFGKTPMSEENEIRAASKVNVFGKIIGDSTVFKGALEGQSILVEKI